MSSSNATMNLSENLLVEDVPSSRFSAMGDLLRAHKRSRHERRKAAKAKATETTQLAEASSSKLVDTTKPGWELDLSLANFEKWKAEEAIRKHNEAHPPKPRPNLQEAKAGPPDDKNSKDKSGIWKRVNGKASNSKTAASSPQTAPNPLPTQATHAGQATHLPVNISFAGPPFAPYGIRNCPVRAQHESGPYRFDELSVPYLIKRIQAKGNLATKADWETVDRFFNLHKVASKEAILARGGRGVNLSTVCER